MDLFANNPVSREDKNIPLPVRMRPDSLEEISGQEHRFRGRKAFKKGD